MALGEDLKTWTLECAIELASVEPYDLPHGYRVDSGVITTDEAIENVVGWEIHLTGPTTFTFTTANSNISRDEIEISSEFLGFLPEDGESFKFSLRAFAPSHGLVWGAAVSAPNGGDLGWITYCPNDRTHLPAACTTRLLRPEQFPFVVARVPEPSSIATFTLIGFLFGLCRRIRNRTRCCHRARKIRFHAET